MAQQIILYDLPSRGKPACWSPNPWKTRAALNFKGLAYKTEWVEYPDLAPTFKSFGMEPNDRSINYADYSSPAVRMPDGSYVMDSRNIADALEKHQPEPSLHLDSGCLERTSSAVGKFLPALAPILIPRVPEKVLNPRSVEYFNETRAKRFGMPLRELAKSDKAGENAWQAAEPGLTELKGILQENQDGPYVMGKQASYADLVILGVWAFAKRLDEGGDCFDRLMKFDPKFQEHFQACEKYLGRDD